MTEAPRRRSAWRAFLDRMRGSPELTWVLLPPYEIPGIAVVGSVLVENRGRSTAYNVKIELLYSTENEQVIHHMQVVSDERYIVRGGGDLHSFVILRLQQMRPGTRVVIHVASHNRSTPEVNVTCYQKNTWNRVRASSAPAPIRDEEQPL